MKLSAKKQNILQYLSLMSTYLLACAIFFGSEAFSADTDSSEDAKIIQGLRADGFNDEADILVSVNEKLKSTGLSTPKCTEGLKAHPTKNINYTEQLENIRDERACFVFEELLRTEQLRAWPREAYQHAALIEDDDTKDIFLKLISTRIFVLNPRIMNWQPEVFQAISLTASPEKKYARKALKRLIATAKVGDWPQSAYLNVFLIRNDASEKSFEYVIDHNAWIKRTLAKPAALVMATAAAVSLAGAAVGGAAVAAPVGAVMLSTRMTSYALALTATYSTFSGAYDDNTRQLKRKSEGSPESDAIAMAAALSAYQNYYEAQASLLGRLVAGAKGGGMSAYFFYSSEKLSGTASTVVNKFSPEKILQLVQGTLDKIEKSLGINQYRKRISLIGKFGGNILANEARNFLMSKGLALGAFVLSLFRTPAAPAAGLAPAAAGGSLFSSVFGSALSAAIAGVVKISSETLGYGTQSDLAFATAAQIRVEPQLKLFKALIKGAQYWDWSELSYNSIIAAKTSRQRNRLAYVLENTKVTNWQDSVFQTALSLSDIAETPLHEGTDLQISHQDRLFRKMIDRAKSTHDWPVEAYSSLNLVNTDQQRIRFEKLLDTSWITNKDGAAFTAAIGLIEGEKQVKLFNEMTSGTSVLAHSTKAYNTLAALQTDGQMRRFKKLLRHPSNHTFNWQDVAFKAVFIKDDAEDIFNALTEKVTYRDWTAAAYDALFSIDTPAKKETFKELIQHTGKLNWKDPVFNAIGSAKSEFACQAIRTLFSKVHNTDWTANVYDTASKIEDQNSLDQFLLTHKLTKPKLDEESPQEEL